MKRKYKKQVAWRLSHLRLRAYHAQNGLCYWCQRPMERNPEAESDARLTADHLLPSYAGGKTKPGNIVAACAKCNHSRQVEVNKPSKAEAVWSAGDDGLQSPFGVLKQRLEGNL
jgi:5-methylcytosine-specific restriction endonuclease McrA